MSKFMFHIRFSDSEGFLHEHEAFEMMRSRNLYQIQFELKRKLHKRIRSLEMAEKMHVNAYQTRRAFFLTKMQERVRLRNKINEGKDKPRDSYKRKEFSDSGLFLHKDYIEEEVLEPSKDGEQDAGKRDDTSPKETPRDKIIKESALPPVTEKEKKDKSAEPITTRVCLSYGGRNMGGSRSGLRRNKTIDVVRANYEMDDNELADDTSDEKVHVNNASYEESQVVNIENDFKKPDTSNGSMRKPFSPMKGANTKKVKNSSVSFISEDTKFMGDLDTAGSRLFTSREPTGDVFLNDGFRRSQASSAYFSDKSRSDDFSLIKQLSTYEMGLSTPDGDLILSRADYDRYMEKFRKAAERRLMLSRKRSENLEQKIRKFSVAKPEVLKEY